MYPDSVFYPLMAFFALGMLVLNFFVDRGMGRAERQSPAQGAVTATVWLIIALIGVPVLCLVSAQLSGAEDVIGVLFGGG